MSKKEGQSLFTRMAMAVAKAAGKPATFMVAVLIVIVWAASGPLFGFGDTWQLVINTSTTIITFLMVFVIQASQNRDTASMHLKLDELIRATGAAHNALLDIDSLDEKQLEDLRKRYESLASSAQQDANVLETMEEIKKPTSARKTAAR